jgi:hypothetical protein
MIKCKTFGFFALIIIITLNISGCNRCSNRDAGSGKSKSAQNKAMPVQQQKQQEDAILKKVLFFIENSGSMFGYVNQANEFMNSLVGLAYLPDFNKADKSFYFINGTSDPRRKSGIKTIFVGNDPDVLKNNLNPASFNRGDVRFSDLNKMFEIALDSAQGDQISILVSDCIYDVGNDQDPLTSLEIEIHKTQQAFLYRLEKEDIQTLIIKAYSKFTGQYFFASKPGSTKLNGIYRPFYVIIFGKTAHLTNLLTEQNISKKIVGSHEMARFLTIDEQKMPCQIVPSQNQKGNFRPDYKAKNKLNNAQPYKGEFQFAFAVDFSTLYFLSDSYLTTIENYSCSNSNFIISKVEKLSKKIPGVEGTYLITVFTDKNPLGDLQIVLKNVMPGWILGTNIDEEIQIDDTHTFGFKSLIDAISEAYEYQNNGKNLATFNIVISN